MDREQLEWNGLVEALLQSEEQLQAAEKLQDKVMHKIKVWLLEHSG